MHRFWADTSLAAGAGGMGGSIQPTALISRREGSSEGTRPPTGSEQISAREFDKGGASQEKVYFPVAPLKKPEALASS